MFKAESDHTGTNFAGVFCLGENHAQSIKKEMDIPSLFGIFCPKDLHLSPTLSMTYKKRFSDEKNDQKLVLSQNKGTNPTDVDSMEARFENAVVSTRYVSPHSIAQMRNWV